jgi:AcrR family transcriptional regulator
MNTQKKSASGSEKKICDAALKLATSQSWDKVTLEQIAKAAKVPLPQLQKIFADTNAILPTIIRLIDAETADSVGKPNAKAPPRDRLFEVMMARFDVLQAHRKAITGIMAAARRNPRMLRYVAPAQWQSMRHMLALAGIKPGDGKEPIVVAGLLAIYGLTLCAWRKDDSIDMARTMAMLDRCLRHAGRISEMIFYLG